MRNDTLYVSDQHFQELSKMSKSELMEIAYDMAYLLGEENYDAGMDRIRELRKLFRDTRMQAKGYVVCPGTENGTP